jgi:hypothetical protein
MGYLKRVCSKWVVGAGLVPALGTHTGVPLQQKSNALILNPGEDQGLGTSAIVA